MVKNSENVGPALGLVCAAGLSTAVGAAVVFFPSLVKLASRRVLAGSLGFSAGVMTYVSFVEIFTKSQSSFEDAGHDPDRAYVYATACFFLGVMVMLLLNAMVGQLLGGHHGHARQHDNTVAMTSVDSAAPQQQQQQQKMASSEPARHNPEDNVISPPCCSKDPVGQLDNFKKMAEKLESEIPSDDDDDDAEIEDDFVDNPPIPSAENTNTESNNNNNNNNDDDNNNDNDYENQDNNDNDVENDEEQKRLVAMGVNTALAIGLHNFPEGLATFVAALEDPKVGAILAFAIAIHNIPEGLCVALPIYYATGNRIRAFLWALLSGASEFIAALLGWAVLANSFSHDLYAILFGSVAGMMVIISIRELLPTAHFYDPQDTVVTYSFIVGMVVISLSLVLFIL